MIRPEDDDERVPLLRQRLMMSGELARAKADGFGFGEDLEAAVRRYQAITACASPAASTSRRCSRSTCRPRRACAQLRINLQRLRDLMAQKHRGPLCAGQCRRPSSSRRSSATRSSSGTA